MSELKILALAAAVTLTAVPAMSASVGTYDATRLHSGSFYSLASGTSSDITTLRADVQGAGHSIVETATVTASFLATVDVFYTGLLAYSGFAFATGEEAALYDWINAGGTMIYQGGNSTWGPTTDAFLSTVGLTHTFTNEIAGSFAAIVSPFLANGVAGAAMYGSGAGGIVGADVTLATSSSGATVAFSETYGAGTVVGMMSADGYRRTAERQFILNVIAYAAPSEVPLPAAAPLLLAALGGLGIMARRRRA